MQPAAGFDYNARQVAFVPTPQDRTTVCTVSRSGAIETETMSEQARRFVTENEMEVEQLPWGPHDWLCRPGLTDAEELLLVRVHMPAGQAHKFHRHPEMEEIIYILSGTAEQWVDREKRILTAGQIAHIPKDVVHGTYNAGSDTLEFLAILSPAKIEGPPLIDMSEEEPWRSLRD